MANDCLVTTLKSSVDNDTLDYLDKGLLVFDNTLTPTQTEQVNKVYMKTISKTEMSCREGSDKFTKPSNYVIVSTDTPANTQYHITWPLSKLTMLVGAEGSGYGIVKCNFRLRMNDIKRCTNLETFNPSSMAMDRYNIVELAVLPSLSSVGVGGKLESEWHGDIVAFADSAIANGVGTSGRKIVFSNANGSTAWNVKVNSVKYTRYIHLVFRADGYDIYAPLSSSTALSDYSGETPVYSKTI